MVNKPAHANIYVEKVCDNEGLNHWM